MRRTVLAGIAAALAPRTLVAQVPQRDEMRRIGVLMASVESDRVGQAWAAALRQGLAALNWHEGGNLRIDWRWAGTDAARRPMSIASSKAPSPPIFRCSGRISSNS